MNNQLKCRESLKRSKLLKTFQPFPEQCHIWNELFMLTVFWAIGTLPFILLFLQDQDKWSWWVSSGKYWSAATYLAMAFIHTFHEFRIRWIVSKHRIKNCNKTKMHDCYIRHRVGQIISQGQGVVYAFTTSGDEKMFFLRYVFWSFLWGKFLTFRDPWKLHIITSDSMDGASMFTEDDGEFLSMLEQYHAAVKVIPVSLHKCSITYRHEESSVFPSKEKKICPKS